MKKLRLDNNISNNYNFKLTIAIFKKKKEVFSHCLTEIIKNIFF